MPFPFSFTLSKRFATHLRTFKRIASEQHAPPIRLISSLCLDKYPIKPRERESYFVLTPNHIVFIHAYGFYPFLRISFVRKASKFLHLNFLSLLPFENAEKQTKISILLLRFSFPFYFISVPSSFFFGLIRFHVFPSTNRSIIDR